MSGVVCDVFLLLGLLATSACEESGVGSGEPEGEWLSSPFNKSSVASCRDADMGGNWGENSEGARLIGRNIDVGIRC